MLPRRSHAIICLACICIAVLLAAVDLTAISTLMPQMIVDLEVPLPDGLNDIVWVVSAYLIGSIITLPIIGQLSDHWQRRPVLIACLVVFALGSICSAIAPTLGWLITARAVQALGAGGMVPITMAIATDLLPSRYWAIAFGIIGAVDTAGWAIGPLYGAVFVRWLDWRWLFWVNVPLTVVIAVVGWHMLAPLRQPSVTRTLPWVNVVIFAVSLTAINLGLSRLGEGAQTGYMSSVPTGPIAEALPWLIGGGILLGGFLIVERRSTSPLLPPSWLKQRSVATAALSNLLFGVLLIVVVVNVPLFINAVAGRQVDSIEQLVRDAAWDSGLALGTMTLLMTVCSPLGGWLTIRFSMRGTTIAGIVLAGIGLWWMRGWAPQTTFIMMLRHLVVVGIGFGVILAPMATVMITTAPPYARGLASSLVLLIRLSGMSLGLSALTAWSLTRFRSLATPYSLSELPLVIDRLTAQVLAGSFGLAAWLALFIVVLESIGGTNHVSIPAPLDDTHGSESAGE